VAPHQGSHDVVSAVNEICDQKESIDSRGLVRGILDAIQRFSFLSLLHFWIEVVRGFHDVQNFFRT